MPEELCLRRRPFLATGCEAGAWGLRRLLPVHGCESVQGQVWHLQHHSLQADLSTVQSCYYNLAVQYHFQ